MALEGSVRDFGLADILQLIYYQRSTGVLKIEARHDKVNLYFMKGNIVSIKTQRRTEDTRIGKILVKKGLISPEQLQKALINQEKSKAMLGNILVKDENVDLEIIKEILKNQVTETIVRVFSWRDGYYSFIPQKVAYDEGIPISIDTQHILIEGLRLQDEWSLINEKITFDTVFRHSKGREGEDVELSPHDKVIFDHIDSETDLGTIVEISDLNDFDITKSINSLMERGLIEPVVEEPLTKEHKTPLTKYAHLIEILLPLMVVVAFVIGIIPFIGGNTLKNIRAVKDIEHINMAIEEYYIENNDYPDGISSSSRGTDPWGNPYILKKTAHGYLVISPGRDGREGTKDDVY